MWLTCKKAWISKDAHTSRWGRHEAGHERISVGKRYKVLNQSIKNNGVRYWLFEIPQPEIWENPIGSGWFEIDEFFITPEEERDLKINQILNDTNKS
jgi:hypothetical protein